MAIMDGGGPKMSGIGILKALAIVVGYIILTWVILPRLGVPT